MTRNVYFSQGSKNEQYLLEDIICESISIWGQDFYYIPRTLVAKDEILGEDRLSKFKTAYPIEMYLETVDGFEGQGAFVQKFGLMMEQSATLTVARRRWDQLIGRYNQAQLPNRPCEGDLLYFPLTKGLFEIKFVQHQDPFYQLGKLYVYKLSVELFQYSSERIDTGLKDIDVFETLKTYDTDYSINITGSVVKINITNPGSGYIQAPSVTISGGEGSSGFRNAIAEAVIDQQGKVSDINITSVGVGYDTTPLVTIGTSWQANAFAAAGSQIGHSGRLYTVIIEGTLGSSGPTHTSGNAINGTASLAYAGVRAAATATIDTNPDLPNSYGDNIKFKAEATDIVFNTNNPFGEVQ